MQTKQVFTDRQWNILRAVHTWQFAGVDELRPDDTVIAVGRTRCPVADYMIVAAAGVDRSDLRRDAESLVGGGYLRATDGGKHSIGRFRLADGRVVAVSIQPSTIGPNPDGRRVDIVVDVDDRHDVLSSWPGPLPRCRFYSLTATGVDALAGATVGIQPKRHKRKTGGKLRPLTAKQTEAIQLFGEHKGCVAAVAAAMGVHRATAQQHIDAARRKLGKDVVERAVKHERLRTDRRGQPIVED